MKKLTKKEAIKTYSTVYYEDLNVKTAEKQYIDEIHKEMSQVRDAITIQKAAELLKSFNYGPSNLMNNDSAFLLDAWKLRQEMGIKEESPICPYCKRGWDHGR